VPHLLKKFLKQVTGKNVPRWDRNVARWCAGGEKQERIFKCRFVPNFKGYFYYKCRSCIRVNLEIEEAENKGLERNNKLGFREISLCGRH